MTHYFVDFENTHPSGKSYIDSIRKGDVIHILYSGTGNTLSVEFLSEMERRGVSLKYHCVYVGTKNALDFQLSSYMGYVIGTSSHKSDHYVIVSRDTGYDNMIAFWNSRNVDVKRVPTLQKGISMIKQKNVSTVKLSVGDSQPATLEELRKYLSDDEHADAVLKIVNENRSKAKISNKLNQYFSDNQLGSAVYNQIKPLLKEKQKL